MTNTAIKMTKEDMKSMIGISGIRRSGSRVEFDHIISRATHAMKYNQPTIAAPMAIR
jgi:hypothetical protein